MASLTSQCEVCTAVEARRTSAATVLPTGYAAAAASARNAKQVFLSMDFLPSDAD
jgi:hypothetical protein